MANSVVDYFLIVYGGKFTGPEQNKFRCPNCSRIIFKHNSTRIMISNAYGVGTTDFDAGRRDETGTPVMISVRCHTCKSRYKILFQ